MLLTANQMKSAKDLGKTLKAMAKVMGNNETRMELCCICVMHNSHTAVACDAVMLAAVNVFSFEEECGEMLVPAYETAAFYAGLKMVEYRNCYVFTNDKMYEKFVGRFGDGLASANVTPFEYPDWTRLLPEWNSLSKDFQATFDPKMTCIVNNVIDAYTEGSEEHFEDRFVETETHRLGIAIYPKMTVALMSKNRTEDWERQEVSRDEYSSIKSLAQFYKHEEEN